MNRTLQLIALLMAVLALTLHGVADAHCKVKADDTTGKEAETGNKIQNAPPNRGRNKIAFDAPANKRATNKIAFDVANSTLNTDDNDDDNDEN